ncbi:MAG: enoyl-CoA hydratase [Acidiferrobacterales bacterium]|nr:enoyl-CoA hydratase [Acidiferrobacterales bacterium]
MTASTILQKSVEGAICTLTLNRPKQYNALSEELLSKMIEALDQIADDDRIRVVILAASGKAFCAGHDLKQMRANDDHGYQHDLFSQCSTMMQKIVGLPQPVIAKVQGMATAAGCQLVATCDLAVAAEECQFAVSGINLGLFCSTPAVALSRNISRKRAMRMLLTGQFIDTATALEYGLINESVPATELNAAVQQLADEVAARPKNAIRLGKRLFYQQLENDLPEAYALATDAIAGNMMLDEAREGIDAFIEKRKPNWPK